MWTKVLVPTQTLRLQIKLTGKIKRTKLLSFSTGHDFFSKEILGLRFRSRYYRIPLVE